jgi:hypothetical protein
MAWINMDVEVELSAVDDQELIDELENRGWFVGEEKGWEPDESLSEDEINYIVATLTYAVPGSYAHRIYEKLRKR